MRSIVSIIFLFAVVAACGSDSSKSSDETPSPTEAAVADPSIATGDINAEEMAAVDAAVDLDAIDPDNVLGNARECVVAELAVFLEGEVADPNADQTQWAYWIADLSSKNCDHPVGLALDPLGGGAYLSEGDLFGGLTTEP